MNAFDTDNDAMDLQGPHIVQIFVQNEIQRKSTTIRLSVRGARLCKKLK